MQRPRKPEASRKLESAERYAWLLAREPLPLSHEPLSQRRARDPACVQVLPRGGVLRRAVLDVHTGQRWKGGQRRMMMTRTLLASIGLLLLLLSYRGPIAIVVHADPAVPPVDGINPDDVVIQNAMEHFWIDEYSMCTMVGICETWLNMQATWENFYSWIWDAGGINYDADELYNFLQDYVVPWLSDLGGIPFAGVTW